LEDGPVDLRALAPAEVLKASALDHSLCVI